MGTSVTSTLTDGRPGLWGEAASWLAVPRLGSALQTPLLVPQELNIPRGKVCFRTSGLCRGEGKLSSASLVGPAPTLPVLPTFTSRNGRWELRLFLINRSPPAFWLRRKCPRWEGCRALIGWLPEPNHVLGRMTMGGSPFHSHPDTWPDRTSFRPICPLTGRGGAATLSLSLPLLCNLCFGKWPFGQKRKIKRQPDFQLQNNKYLLPDNRRDKIFRHMGNFLLAGDKVSF